MAIHSRRDVAVHLLQHYNSSFSALTLLVWRQEGHLACKIWVMGCWHGYVSEAGCRFVHMAQLMPLPLTISCFSKSRLVLPFWYRLTQVVPDKGLLNGCSVVVVITRVAVILANMTDLSQQEYDWRCRLSHINVTDYELRKHDWWQRFGDDDSGY